MPGWLEETGMHEAGCYPAEQHRLLHARAASDNMGSLRVLQKSGFKIIGTENSSAPGHNSQIEEAILRAD
jgi:hypothetical protein